VPIGSAIGRRIRPSSCSNRVAEPRGRLTVAVVHEAGLSWQLSARLVSWPALTAVVSEGRLLLRNRFFRSV
jgi:hypothetical protein